MSGNATHKPIVQYDRARVICSDCPWFKHDAELTADELREAGRRHQHAVDPSS